MHAYSQIPQLLTQIHVCGCTLRRNRQRFQNTPPLRASLLQILRGSLLLQVLLQRPLVGVLHRGRCTSARHMNQRELPRQQYMWRKEAWSGERCRYQCRSLLQTPERALGAEVVRVCSVCWRLLRVRVALALAGVVLVPPEAHARV